MSNDEKKQSLLDDEITSERKDAPDDASRRSLLGKLAVAGTAAALIPGCHRHYDGPAYDAHELHGHH